MNRPTIITLAVDQSAEIAPGVRLMLVGVVRQAEAKIGVDAPRSMPIHRAEVGRRVDAERAEAEGRERAARRREAVSPRPLSGWVRKHLERKGEEA
jgi:sRNA-binding carbon storage regulator CsrA